MAEWRVYEYDTPQCTSCGMWMPFARYRRGWGTNARYITNYCPHCGKKMTAMPMCGNCKYGQGKWKEDGICYAFVDGCLWCMVGRGDGVLPDQFCDYGERENKFVK